MANRKYKLSNETLESLRQRLGVEPNDNSKDEVIYQLTPYRILDTYLAWHGIIGYSPYIIRVLREVGIKFPENKGWPWGFIDG